MLMVATIMKLYGVSLDENFEIAKEIAVKRIRQLLAAAAWTDGDIDNFVNGTLEECDLHRRRI
jgi:hypothetical protein